LVQIPIGAQMYVHVAVKVDA